VNWVLYTISFNSLLLMFYLDLYIINVYVILPPDLGPFAVNKYIHKFYLKYIVRVQVLTVTNMNMTVFWRVALCSLVEAGMMGQ
jgi:hypothetical protein